MDEVELLGATRMKDKYTFHRPVERDELQCMTKCTCGKWIDDEQVHRGKSRVHTERWLELLERS